MDQQTHFTQTGTEPVSAPADRRTAPRFPSTSKLFCYPAGSGLLQRRAGRVRNVSKTGVGLLLDKCWQPGTVMMIELPGAEGPRTVRGRVIHATSQPAGTFLVGCVLDQPMTDAELQALTQ
jgi:hypothetical protein